MSRKLMTRTLMNNIPGRDNNPYGSRHLFLLPACFVFAGLLLLILSGCAQQGDGYTTQREEEVAMKEESGFAEISRPPIDLELPAGLKTATLAMG